MTNGESPSFVARYSSLYLCKRLKFNSEPRPQQGRTISKFINRAFVCSFSLQAHYLLKLFCLYQKRCHVEMFPRRFRVKRSLGRSHSILSRQRHRLPPARHAVGPELKRLSHLLGEHRRRGVLATPPAPAL